MPTALDPRTAKGAQVSVRIPASVDAWLRRRAGKHRTKADVVRQLLEEEIAREEVARLQRMFDAAAQELTEEDREDRDLILGSFSDKE